MNKIKPLLWLLVLLGNPSSASAHDAGGKMHYLGNEAVLVDAGKTKILFDPFFHNSYGLYTLVPEKIRQAIFANQSPYDNINLVLISHAHEDHFDAKDMLKYLRLNQKVQLIAPQQAVEQLLKLSKDPALVSRINVVKLDYGQKPFELTVDNILVEAVRIPHAGWPGRAAVENLVFRVSLTDSITVMHLGDADPDKQHFLPHNDFWQQRQTHAALPPYWFFASDEGRFILQEVINSQHSTGIHVPSQVPAGLKKSGADYFSKPGEVRIIN